MIKKWFLRLFPEYRELKKNIDAKNAALDLGAAVIRSYRDEFKAASIKASSDAALIESLNRYIEALEGRDKGRVKRIDELERVCCEAQALINELRDDLSGITGNKKESNNE